jgi:hypothetical protein
MSSMRGHWGLICMVCVVGLVSACSDDTETSALDPVDADSCADLADKYVEITGDIIDQIGNRTDAEMESPPADLEAASDDWFNVCSELIPRTGELCDEGEFDELLCDLKSGIEPGEQAGEHFLRDKYPTCSDSAQ